MHKLTRGIASASARHPWRTITAWLAVTGRSSSSPSRPAARSSTTSPHLAARAPRRWSCSTRASPRQPRAPPWSCSPRATARRWTSTRTTIAKVLDDVSGVAHVESVADPFAAGTISEDGRIGFAVITLDAPEREIGKPAFAVLSEAVSWMGAPGLQVELGGDAAFLNAAEESSSHTAIGLLVALLVLLVVFGTVVAAIVPIGLSLVAVGPPSAASC